MHTGLAFLTYSAGPLSRTGIADVLGGAAERPRYVLGSALRALVSLPRDATHRNELVMVISAIVASSGMQDFRKLRAWQESRELTTKIYRATAAFPPVERFGLVSQMRRAMVSVGANMAEGCGRATRADTLRFFQMSFASGTELLHHLIIALDLGFLTQEQFGEFDAQLERVRRMTAGFMRRLRGGPG